jgi:hypothetical protein
MRKEPISAETARFLLSIRMSEVDHSRMQELMDKSNDGTLTPEDEAEFDSYLNIADLLTVMHSRARVALRGAGLQPPRDDRSFFAATLKVREGASRAVYLHDRHPQA